MTGEQETCERLRELVGEYALGDEAELSQDERAQAEEHLAACPACREHVEQLCALADALRSVSQVEVPQEVLFTTRSRVMAAVRSKLRELALEEERRFSRVRLWRRAIAAVAMVVIALGVWQWLSHGESIPPTDRPPTPLMVEGIKEYEDARPALVTKPTPAVSLTHEPEKSWAGETAGTAKAASEGLRLLEDAFVKAKARERQAPEAFERIIADARALVARPWRPGKDGGQSVRAGARPLAGFAQQEFPWGTL